MHDTLIQRNVKKWWLTAPVTVGGSVIERVVTYKLLGVYISDDLLWNLHMEHIVKKANKRL